MSLPKSFRLPLRFEKDRINKEGNSISGRYFSLVVADNQTNSARFAIIISKKISPLAVERNRLRRVISGILYQSIPQISPKDYLIIPRYSSLDQPTQILKKELLNLLNVKSTS